MSSSSSSDEEEKDYEEKPIQSLDDLPTDDSVSLGTSSDDDDSSSEDDDEQPQETKNIAVGYDEASSSSSDDDSSSESSSDDDSSSSDGKEVEERKNVLRGRQSDGDDSGSSSSDNDSQGVASTSDRNEDDLHNVPLEERIWQRQEAGMSRNTRFDAKERKTRALQVASERLHQHKQQSSDPSEKKKKSKHKPTEASSKRRDFFQRGAPTLDSSGVGVGITSHLYKPRDPRIMGATSKSTGALDKNYDFLQELRDDEIRKLKKQVAVRKLSGKKGQKARRKLGLQTGSLQVCT